MTTQLSKKELEPDLVCSVSGMDGSILPVCGIVFLKYGRYEIYMARFCYLSQRTESEISHGGTIIFTRMKVGDVQSQTYWRKEGCD